MHHDRRRVVLSLLLLLPLLRLPLSLSLPLPLPLLLLLLLFFFIFLFVRMPFYFFVFLLFFFFFLFLFFTQRWAENTTTGMYKKIKTIKRAPQKIALIKNYIFREYENPAGHLVTSKLRLKLHLLSFPLISFSILGIRFILQNYIRNLRFFFFSLSFFLSFSHRFSYARKKWGVGDTLS